MISSGNMSLPNRCKVAGLLLITFFLSKCHSISPHVDNKSPENSYPLINYDTQTPWGTHDVSISHNDIDYESLATNKVKLYDAVIGVVARRIMSNSGETLIQRDLGDFDELNKLFNGLVISIPDINKIHAGKYGFSHVFVWIRNLKCFDMSVDNITIKHKQKSKREYDLSVDIQNLAISCNLNWR